MVAVASGTALLDADALELLEGDELLLSVVSPAEHAARVKTSAPVAAALRAIFPNLLLFQSWSVERRYLHRRVTVVRHGRAQRLPFTRCSQEAYMDPLHRVSATL
jgi:hypothetical protein